MDAQDIAAEAPRAPAAPAPKRPARRARAADAPVDTESLIRGVVTKLQIQGNAEAERLRDGIRRAIALLQTAVGS